jgi:phage-related protein
VGFKKTTQQTSKRDIELARERQKEIKEGAT